MKTGSGSCDPDPLVVVNVNINLDQTTMILINWCVKYFVTKLLLTI